VLLIVENVGADETPKRRGCSSAHGTEIGIRDPARDRRAGSGASLSIEPMKRCASIVASERTIMGREVRDHGGPLLVDSLPRD
jgi:hypothetical protein